MSASQTERKQYHLCLDCAMEILDLIETGGTPVRMGDLQGRELGLEQVIAAIKLHFPDHPFDLKDEDSIGEMIAMSLAQHGPSTCAMWTIGHNLEHIMFGSGKIEV